MYIKSPFPPLPPLPEVNVHHVMFGRPEQASSILWPDYTIHIDDRTGRRRTYKELQRDIALTATALGAKVFDGGLGLDGEGDEIIGVLGNNSMEYIDLVFALLTITTPFALISTYSTRFELVHALKLTKATRLFVDANLLNKVLAALEDLDVRIPLDKIYVLAGDLIVGRQSLRQLIDAVQRKQTPLEPVRPARRETLAYLLMSSGTTGLPKAVMITHSNLVCSFFQGVAVAQASAPFSVCSTDAMKNKHPITMGVLPMFHTYGLHSYILRSTIVPSTCVILDKWNTARYLKAVAEYHATSLTLTPSAVHQMVNHPDIKKTDLGSVVTFNSGAAYTPPELAAQMVSFLPRKAQFWAGYGMSECTISVLARPFEGMLNMGPPPRDTTGILIPGMEARIVRDDGSGVDCGEAGELLLRGPNVMQGYWNNPQGTADAFAYGPGWLRTGDRFRVDEQGYFFFVERAKDTLKVSGEQVSPTEIEDVLFAHPERLISDVSVAGVSGGRTNDEKVPRAWVVLSGAGQKRGAAAVIKALQKWHQESLSKFKWLRGGIEIVSEIPKTPTGKIKRRVLQDDYERRVKESRAKL
ncbi:hypothetical protein C8R43DRAFT_869121 [Mycena crocata]|nr:hypothetical protein C8R43DRAFT_869121 [Mycena crocata]